MAEPEQTYEEAREELVEVVQRLEQGGDGLAESIALWERGEALARTCQTWLEGARRRLEETIEATAAAGAAPSGAAAQPTGDTEP